MTAASSRRSRRNRNFDDTHRILLEKAVEMIGERGADAVSVSALARESGINRSTVYYHFESREELVEAVRRWSAEQIALGADTQVDQLARIGHVTGFVLANPEVTRLWIDAFIAAGDIRDRYPMWEALVAGIGGARADESLGPIDAEVFCTILLTGALIGPRVFRNSVDPAASDAEIVARFTREQLRMIRAYGFDAPAPEGSASG